MDSSAVKVTFDRQERHFYGFVDFFGFAEFKRVRSLWSRRLPLIECAIDRDDCTKQLMEWGAGLPQPMDALSSALN